MLTMNQHRSKFARVRRESPPTANRRPSTGDGRWPPVPPRDLGKTGEFRRSSPEEHGTFARTASDVMDALVTSGEAGDQNRKRKRRKRKISAPKQSRTIYRDDVTDETPGKVTEFLEEGEEALEDKEQDEEEEEDEENEEEEDYSSCGVGRRRRDNGAPVQQQQQQQPTRAAATGVGVLGLDQFCGKLKLYANSVREAQSKLSELIQDLSGSTVLLDCSSHSHLSKSSHKDQNSRLKPRICVGNPVRGTPDTGLRYDDSVSYDYESGSNDGDWDSIEDLRITPESIFCGKEKVEHLPLPTAAMTDPEDRKQQSANPLRSEFDDFNEEKPSVKAITSPSPPSSDEQLSWPQRSSSPPTISRRRLSAPNENLPAKKRLKFNDQPDEQMVLKSATPTGELDPSKAPGEGGCPWPELKPKEEDCKPGGGLDAGAVRERYLSAESTFVRLTSILRDRRKSKNHIDARIASLKRDLTRLEREFLREKDRFTYDKRQLHLGDTTTSFDHGYSPGSGDSIIQRLDSSQTTRPLNGTSEIRIQNPEPVGHPVRILCSQDSALELVTTGRYAPVSHGVTEGVAIRQTGCWNKNSTSIAVSSDGIDPVKSDLEHLLKYRPPSLTNFSGQGLQRGSAEEKVHVRTPSSSSGAQTTGSSQPLGVVNSEARAAVSRSSAGRFYQAPPFYHGSKQVQESVAHNLEVLRGRFRELPSGENFRPKGATKAISTRQQDTGSTPNISYRDGSVHQGSSGEPLMPPKDSHRSPENLSHFEGTRATRFAPNTGTLEGPQIPTASNPTHSNAPVYSNLVPKFRIVEHNEKPRPGLPGSTLIRRETGVNLSDLGCPKDTKEYRRRVFCPEQEVYPPGVPSNQRWMVSNPGPQGDAVTLHSPSVYPHLAFPSTRTLSLAEQPNIRQLHELTQRNLLDGAGKWSRGGAVPLQYPSEDLVFTYLPPGSGVLPFADFRDIPRPAYLSRGQTIPVLPAGHHHHHQQSRMVGYLLPPSEAMMFPLKDGAL